MRSKQLHPGEKRLTRPSFAASVVADKDYKIAERKIVVRNTTGYLTTTIPLYFTANDRCGRAILFACSRPSHIHPSSPECCYAPL